MTIDVDGSAVRSDKLQDRLIGAVSRNHIHIAAGIQPDRGAVPRPYAVGVRHVGIGVAHNIPGFVLPDFSLGIAVFLFGVERIHRRAGDIEGVGDNGAVLGRDRDSKGVEAHLQGFFAQGAFSDGRFGVCRRRCQRRGGHARFHRSRVGGGRRAKRLVEGDAACRQRA